MPSAPMPISDPRAGLKRSILKQNPTAPPIISGPPELPPGQKPDVPPGVPPILTPPGLGEKPNVPPFGPPVNNPPNQSPDKPDLPINQPMGGAMTNAGAMTSATSQPHTAYAPATTNTAPGLSLPSAAPVQAQPMPERVTATATPQSAPAAPGNFMEQERSWLNFVSELTGQSASTGFVGGGQQYRGNLQPLVDQYNAKNGAQAKAVGIDKIDFGDGRGPVDVLTGDGRFWYDEDGPGGRAPGSGGAATGGGGAPGGAGAGAGAGSAYQQQIRDIIMKRLADAQAPVDVNGQEIAAPFGAAKLEAERNTDQERKALAERRAATGDTSGSLEQGIQQSAERNAVGLGGLKASLISKQYDKKRTELSDLLQLATASGDAESARALQAELANLDATVRREGLGLDAAKYEAYLRQQSVLAGLNG